MRQESRHDGSTTCELHPGIFTWNLKMDLWKLWKTIFLYKPVVFRFHVNLPECNNRLLDHHCLHYELTNMEVDGMAPFPLQTGGDLHFHVSESECN